MKPDKFLDEIALDKGKFMALANECWDTYLRARKHYYDVWCVDHFAKKPPEEWDGFNRTLARNMEKPLRDSLVSKFGDKLKIFDFLAFKLEDHHRVLTDGIYTVNSEWVSWEADPSFRFRALYANLEFDVEVVTGKSFMEGDPQIKDRISDLFTSLLLDEVIIYGFRLKHFQRSQSMDSINEVLKLFYEQVQIDVGFPLMESPLSKVWVTSTEGAVATEHHTSFDNEENVYSLYLELEIKRPLAFTDHVFRNLLSKMITLKKEQNKAEMATPRKPSDQFGS
jgi:hypothetical protein